MGLSMGDRKVRFHTVHRSDLLHTSSGKAPCDLEVFYIYLP